MAVTFSATFADPDGYSDIGLAELLIPSDTAKACWVYYRRSDATLWMLNDTQSAAVGPLTPGSAGTLSNGQCTLYGTGSTAAGSGSNLTVSFRLAFNPSFGGYRNLFALARDAGGSNTSWQLVGSWNISSNQPPVAVSLNPASGTGLSANFRAVFSDPDGYQNIDLLELLIPGAGSAACWAFYRRSDSSLWLVNDAQSAALGPASPGSPVTLANSQCSLNAAQSSVNGTGTNLNVTFALTFKPPFAGAHNVFVLAQDITGAGTPWQPLGTWTVGY
jgi:hypothetical protein